MKLRLSALALMLILFSFAGTISAVTSLTHKDKKIHVSKDQIFSNGKQIFVKINDDFFKTNRIHKSADGKNFFIFHRNMKKISRKAGWDDDGQYYQCSKCGRVFDNRREFALHRAICPRR